MTLVKWNPGRSLFDFRSDLFDPIFNTAHMGMMRDSWKPAVDVEEDDNGYHLHMELPGMGKDDVSISFRENILTISGEKKEESEKNDRSYHCYERRYGKFERSFRISSPVVDDKIEANFKNGVLTIDLPKAEIAKPKQIEVKVK